MAYEKTVATNTTLAREVIKVIANMAATAAGKLAALSATFVHNAAAADHITGTGLEAFVADTKIKVVGSVSNDGIYTIASKTTNDLTLIATDVLVSEGPTADVEIFGIEEFVITPTRKTELTVIAIMYTTDTGMTFSLAPGAFWAGGVALTGAVTITLLNLLSVETAKYLQADGTMILTLIPVIAKALLTDHAAEVGLVELP